MFNLSLIILIQIYSKIIQHLIEKSREMTISIPRMKKGLLPPLKSNASIIYP